MRRGIQYITFLILFFCIHTYAGPARRGNITIFQPDSTYFNATIRGDEFIKIRTTVEGHAIIQQEDGWWCYAVYDSDGTKRSSGWKVGSDAPSAVLSESMNIPLDKMTENALMKRSSHLITENEPIFRRIKGRVATKSENEQLTKHGIVILAQFRDVKFRYKKEDFIRLLTEQGYSDNNATGSAKEYFDAQFNGQVRFDFDVSDIVTLSRNMSYFGANNTDGSDNAPAEMIQEACTLADKEIDFSLYDDDNDGEVDNIFVFFAGADEADGASEDCIWSHAWYIASGAGINLILDGKKIDRYACTSELSRSYGSDGKIEEKLSGIGTFCHEYSHTFGLPDLYDTDYEKSGGWAAGVWTHTSLMDGGNQNNNGNTPPYFNAIEREILGLNEPIVLEETGTYTIAPIHKDGGFYRINTDNEDEYYLLECRKAEGWDSHIGGSGMLMYHIDKSGSSARKWTHLNNLNATPSHQCADLIEADSRKDSFNDANEMKTLTANLNGIFYPYGEVNSLTPDTTPALSFWSGNKGDLGIVSIRRKGDNILFNLVNKNESVSPPTPVNIRSEAFADGAIIRFESSYIYDGDATITWARVGQEGQTSVLAPYEPGKYAFITDGMESTGKTYEASISFIRDNIEGEAKKVSIMTKRKPSIVWPCIYFGSADRNHDGTFPSGSRIPLKVYNATSAAEVIWRFNDARISHEGDGYYTLTRSGTLRVDVLWEDGSRDTVVKEIRITK